MGIRYVEHIKYEGGSSYFILFILSDTGQTFKIHP